MAAIQVGCGIARGNTPNLTVEGDLVGPGAGGEEGGVEARGEASEEGRPEEDAGEEFGGDGGLAAAAEEFAEAAGEQENDGQLEEEDEEMMFRDGAHGSIVAQSGRGEKNKQMDFGLWLVVLTREREGAGGRSALSEARRAKRRARWREMGLEGGGWNGQDGGWEERRRNDEATNRMECDDWWRERGV